MAEKNDSSLIDWEGDASDPFEMRMASKDSSNLQNVPCRGRRGRGRGRMRGRGRGLTPQPPSYSFQGPPQPPSYPFQGPPQPLSSYFQGTPQSVHGNELTRANYWHGGYEPSVSSQQIYRNSWKHTDKVQMKRGKGSPTPSDSASNVSSLYLPIRSDIDFGRSLPFHSRGSYNRKQNMSNFRKKILSPNDLANALSEFDNFSASLLTIFDKYNLDYNEVKEVVIRNDKTFVLNGEAVTLRPQIEFCSSYSSDKGCSDIDKCGGLHICLQYIKNNCNNRNCLHGHYFKTNHNNDIFGLYSLQGLQVPSLKRLLNSLLLGETYKKVDDLMICKEYNRQKCDKEDCNYLHLCLKYVGNLCTAYRCTLNHSVTAKSVKALLEACDISVNESPRDILMTIKSCPLVKRALESVDNPMASISIEEKSDFKISDESPDPEDGVKKSDGKKNGKVVQTTYSVDFLGEITIDEICYNSVENYCPYEESGCWRLHCNNHFHWQAREKPNPWFNLREFQCVELERAFCNPQIQMVDLPVLDPLLLDDRIRGLFVKALKGRSQWVATFDTMQLTLKNPTNQQPQPVLELRRLCTEDTPDKKPEPCFFIWFFCDKNGKWIEYGQVDSTGDSSLIPNVKSHDIEMHRRNRPNSPLPFQSSKFSYFIDTMELEQTNLETNVKRKVRRRPKPHLKDNREESSSRLPSNWDPMLPEERIKVISLTQSTSEYQEVLAYVGKQGGNYNITKIERIQNPFLYKAFQNKVKEMESILKSKEAVNIQRLFHGTNANVVKNICEENFDWRLHGSSAGQAYGAGTYFSPLPSTSHSYTKPDVQGLRYMFIAQVAVGVITTGNSSMARPPINPQTNFPYDSTGNSSANPSIIVKYDKQEYYPEYLLTIT